MDFRTAKDLPTGAEIEHRGTAYLKGRGGIWACDSLLPPNYDITDDDMDKVLASGGIITRVPVGRGEVG